MAEPDSPAGQPEPERRGGEQLTTGRAGGSLALAIAIGTAGGTLFALLKLPLPWMLGAMVFVTVASISGAPVRMPFMLRQCMVVFIGTMLGSQFTPELLERIDEWIVSVTGLLVFGITAMTLVLAYLKRFGRYDPVTAYFASAPGGLNDMTIIGRDMGGDDRVIALTQASRILLVVLTIPVMFQIFGGYEPPESLIGDGPGFLDLPAREWALLLGCAICGPVIARAGRLTSTPWRSPPERSTMRAPGVSRAKSQNPTMSAASAAGGMISASAPISSRSRARLAIRGRSILPL